jgi:hypothetical protein
MNTGRSSPCFFSGFLRESEVLRTPSGCEQARLAVVSPRCGPGPLSPELRNRTSKWFDVLVLVGNHDPHLEITTSKSTNTIVGNGYSLTMKSKSKNTGTGDNTTVHFKQGSSGSTYTGTGDNNQAWLHGTSNSVTWNGSNNSTGNNP